MQKAWIRPRHVSIGAVLTACFWFVCSSGVALEYPGTAALNNRLRELASANAEFMRAETLARSGSSNEILMVEFGRGETKERLLKPAMLAIAGLEGNDLAGSAVLLHWAEELAYGASTNDTIRGLLDSRIIYVITRANPDGAEFYFSKPRQESTVNRVPTDDDHDGLVDEDGPEDLDGDGLITWMRVKDPEGEYILDPEDNRLVIKADAARGEVGAYKLFSEGIDNDRDEQWNEDPPGGVNLNRNFPHNFKFFAPDSGIHAVSDPVSRSLADFVVAHPHIGLVFAFGAADNLTEPPKAEPPKRPPVGPHPDDVPFLRELGKNWRESLGLKKELPGRTELGTFAEWLYYDRGRLALAARPWTPAIQLAVAKPEAAAPKDGHGSDTNSVTSTNIVANTNAAAGKTNQVRGAEAKTEDKRNEEDRNFLKWLDQNAPAEFVKWKPFDHPDFKGKEVEIGGFAPFARSNPPESSLGEWARKESAFLTSLAGKLPRVGIRKLQSRHLGQGVFEITAQVENSGYLPTMTAQGGVTREVNPTRVVLNVDEKEILSGARRTMLEAIPGSGGMKEIRYVIHGKNGAEVQVEVISALGGTATAKLTLKED